MRLWFVPRSKPWKREPVSGPGNGIEMEKLMVDLHSEQVQLR
jgi:hypothetical protein